MVGRTHSSRLNMLRILRHCRGTNLGIGEASFCDSPTAKINQSKNLFMKELRTTIIKKTFPRQVKKVKHTSSLPHFLSPRVGLQSKKTNHEWAEAEVQTWKWIVLATIATHGTLRPRSTAFPLVHVTRYHRRTSPLAPTVAPSPCYDTKTTELTLARQCTCTLNAFKPYTPLF